MDHYMMRNAGPEPEVRLDRRRVGHVGRERTIRGLISAWHWDGLEQRVVRQKGANLPRGNTT